MRMNLALLFPALLILSACASGPQGKSAEESAAPATTQEMAAEKGTTGAVAGAGVTGAGMSSPAAQLQELQQKSVFFDFDQYTVKPEYHDVIQQQAEFLKANAGTLTLEGNADERGSAEYNLALGNKRAQTVRKALEVMGVQGSRVEVVSFGEEKPRASCHEEKCWSENRRVDFNGKLANP